MTKMSKSSKFTAVGTLIVGAAMAFIVPMNNYWMSILISFCYFTILASSLNLLLGYTGQVSLGHNAFMCIGAYSYSIFAVKFGFVGSQLIGLLLGLVVPFIFGLFIGVACSRLSAIFLAMTTAAFARSLKAFIIAEKWLTGGANGLTAIPKMKLFGMNELKVAEYNQILYFIILAVTGLIVLFCWRLINSRTGRAFRAIRNSEIAAAAMGINVTGYKFLVCGISAAMAGLAGVFYAWNFSYLSADMFDKLGIRLLTMAVVGGMGTIPGPIVGAVVMGYLPELLRTMGQQLELMYGLLIVVIFLFMPTGIYGGFRQLKDWVVKTFIKKPADAVAGEED